MENLSTEKLDSLCKKLNNFEPIRNDIAHFTDGEMIKLNTYYLKNHKHIFYFSLGSGVKDCADQTSNSKKL